MKLFMMKNFLENLGVVNIDYFYLSEDIIKLKLFIKYREIYKTKKIQLYSHQFKIF